MGKTDDRIKKGVPKEIAIKTFKNEKERDQHMADVKSGKTVLTNEQGFEIEAMTEKDEHFGQIGLQMMLGCINDGHLEPLGALLIMLSKMTQDPELPDWVMAVAEPIQEIVIKRMAKTLKDESKKIKKKAIDTLTKNLLDQDPEGMPN